MKITVNQVDALLPQTQCTLCGYEGCRPYAEAILYKHEAIDKCLPGGVETLLQLGECLEREVEPWIIEGMAEKTKPSLLAVIDEAICIGCKKCIQVCPVDAILGAPKQMHSVIGAECTGCELCVPACPVDCIEMVTTKALSASEKSARAQHNKSRYLFRQMRLQREKMESAEKHRQMKFGEINDEASKVEARQAEIRAAVARARERKNEC